MDWSTESLVACGFILGCVYWFCMETVWRVQRDRDRVAAPPEEWQGEGE